MTDKTNCCGCNTNPSPDRLLDQNEAAKILSVSPLTLECWRWKGGKGPKFVKLGKLCRYRESDLYAYIMELANK